MSTKKIITSVLAVLILIGLVLFVGIQFVPVDRTNPPVVREPNWDSPQTRAMMERACFDCHSNETRWPWYSNIAPISWSIAREVHEGRRSLNYSDWNPNRPNESLETILQGRMPPRQYMLLHPEARLTDSELQSLVAGMKATFGANAEQEGERARDEDRDEN
jgi:Haem-binding domain